MQLIHKSLTFIQKSFIAVFCCFFISSIQHIQANELESKVFIIGVEAVDYSPLFYFDYLNSIKPSFTRELLTDFFSSKGYRFKFLPLPIKRFDQWFVEQRIDFKFPDNKRWREKEVYKDEVTYSEPVIFLTAGAYVHKKNHKIVRNDVKKVGTISGFYPTLWLDKVTSGDVKIIESDNSLGTVRHLLYGNVDVINIDLNVIKHNLEKLGERESIVLNQQMPNEKYFYTLSSIEHPEIIREFNQYLITSKEKISLLKLKYHIEEE